MNESIAKLLLKLQKLRKNQLQHFAHLLEAMTRPVSYVVEKSSDFASPDFAENFGDILVLHHATSSEPFTKDKLEHAMNRMLAAHGHASQMAKRGNPGHDLTVDGQRWSLKSQADKTISDDYLHISKFMELGKGRWETVQDLAGLRAQMLRHMESYDRIFSLRRLSPPLDSNAQHRYELVEIPKQLLAQANTGELRMVTKSRQTPKPGYCTVKGRNGDVLFELYFDGGTERKLQIRKLKKSLCRVHATWLLG